MAESLTRGFWHSWMILSQRLSVICSGPLAGKQFTYALLDERVPATRTLARDEALARLVTRFFTSHGPATARDFAWWAGLTIADTKTGLRRSGDRLARVVVENREYWFAPDVADAAASVRKPAVHLLPGYDEYLVACREDGASFHPGVRAGLRMSADALRPHFILLNGRLAGGWSRRLLSRRVEGTNEENPVDDTPSMRWWERAFIEYLYKPE
jgi:hypothetical protein